MYQPPQRVVTKRGANHGLHVALTIFTCGIWAITGWPIAAAMGRKTTTTATPAYAPPPYQQPYGPPPPGYYPPQQPYGQQPYPQQQAPQAPTWAQPEPPRDQRQ